MKSPKAPDPYETAQAQTQLNQNTAVTQQLLNMVDQNNPWGSVSYTQNGSTTFTGADGKTYTVPRFSQSTVFTPEQQAIFDASQKAETNLANLAADQSGFLQDYMSKPFEYTNRDAENWAYDLAAPRLLQQQQQDEGALRSRLINSGLRPGTDAYNMEMTRLSQGQSDQLNQLALQGRQMGFGEALATRNQPINEITALLSGSQVSNPAQMSGATPQTQVAGADMMGMASSNYAAAKQAQGAMLGGLFGGLGSIAGAAIPKISDIRIKTDIKRLGELENGLPIYSYKYKWGGPTEIGLMAQDVEKVVPAAVVEIAGFKAVDYGKAISWRSS